jgi:hypothetical protein
VSYLKLNMFNLVAIFRVLINRISKKRINEAISNYVGKELARIWSPLLPSPHEFGKQKVVLNVVLQK